MSRLSVIILISIFILLIIDQYSVSCDDYSGNPILSFGHKIKKGLNELHHRKKKLAYHFFDDLSRKFGALAEKLKPPHLYPKPIPVIPGYEKPSLIPPEIGKPGYELPGSFEKEKPFIEKPIIEKPIIDDKPIIGDKPFIEKPIDEGEGKEDIDDIKLDARTGNKRRPKRAIKNFQQRMKEINDGYEKVILKLKNDLTNDNDEKKKGDLKELISHIEEAQRRFSTINKFLDEKKVNSPEEQDKLEKYFQTIYDSELSRIESILKFEKNNRHHIGGQEPALDARKDAKKHEREDKHKVIPILIAPNPGSKKSPRKDDLKKEEP